MPIDPVANPANLGAPTNASRIQSAKERRQATKAKRFGEVLDEAELSSIDEVEAADPTRSVKPNESEESHEDRTQHGYYRPDQRPGPSPSDRPHIDVSG